ncbi:MAG TPA: K(+)-transporting ATPase subunit F [Steroidobacteraceae bacterium]|nr:K(+)-transporting ATPase subunit F [Steroidobacteraceae bacterium]
MNAEMLLGALLTIGLVGYLLYALFNPERF